MTLSLHRCIRNGGIAFPPLPHETEKSAYSLTAYFLRIHFSIHAVEKIRIYIYFIPKCGFISVIYIFPIGYKPEKAGQSVRFTIQFLGDLYFMLYCGVFASTSFYIEYIFQRGTRNIYEVKKYLAVVLGKKKPHIFFKY